MERVFSKTLYFFSSVWELGIFDSFHPSCVRTIFLKTLLWILIPSCPILSSNSSVWLSPWAWISLTFLHTVEWWAAPIKSTPLMGSSHQYILNHSIKRFLCKGLHIYFRKTGVQLHTPYIPRSPVHHLTFTNISQPIFITSENKIFLSFLVGSSF